MKISVNKLFLIILIVSPLLSLTGENQFSTGLNLASILNLPSVNSLNYIFLLVVVFLFIYFNTNKTPSNLIVTVVCIACLLIFLPRNFTFFAFLGIVTILSTFLIFMKDVAGVTTLSDRNCEFLFRIYTLYIVLSVVAHIGLLLVASKYYANDRMMGIFKNPNQFGFFLVAYNLFYLVKIRKSSGLKSYFIFITVTVLIVMTGSRSALLAQLLIHFTDYFINKRWAYLTAIFIFGVTIAVLSKYADTDKAIALISRRDPRSIEKVGDMRMQIFLNTIKENTFEQTLIGRDASVGTGGFIFEQRSEGEGVIWLDSLINVLFYNWGLFGLFLFGFFVFADFYRQFPILTRHFFVIILYLISSYFFVIGDFFPLPFLLIFLKNNLDE